jgi:exopolysaccharide production protein ExoQ
MTRRQFSDFVPALAAALAAPIGVLAPNGMAVLLAAAGLLVVVAEPGRLYLAHIPTIPKIAAMALLVWIAASVFWAPDFDMAVGGAVRVLPAAFLGLVLADKALSLDGDARRYLALWLLGGVCFAAILLAANAASVLVTGSYREALFAHIFGPVGGTAAFTNRSKTVLVLLLPMAVAIAWQRHGPVAAAALVALAAFPLIHGEAAAAGIAVAVAIFGAAFGWLGGRRAMALLGIGLAACILLAPSIARLPLFDELAQRRDIHVSFFHRAAIWEFVGARVAEKPVFGWGMNASRGIPDGQTIVSGAAEQIPLHPHNAPLQIWLELGAVGAVFVAVLACFLAFACTGPPARQAVLGATLLVGVFIASVSYGIWQGWWFATLWLAAALACAVGQDSLGPEPTS